MDIKMDVEELRQYAEVMRDMDLTVLELKGESSSLRMERNQSNAILTMESAGTKELPGQTQDSGKTAAKAPGENQITSPMVGMFYVAPAEDADPFVQVGDKVKAGDTVCIIEAMKLMNEIVADQDGVITEILVANGTIVEFGQPLFRIRKE